MAVLDAANLKTFIDGIVRNVNHEFRTPLNLIVGHCELLTDLLSSNDREARESLAIILRSAKNIERLLRTVMTLASLQQKAVDLRASPINLATLLTRLGRDCAFKCAEKHLRFTLNIADHDLTVRYDEESLHHALSEMLDNAVKFTLRGTVALSAHKIGPQRVSISVSDSGIGIASHECERICEAFYQVDMATTRNFRGMGLGLTLAQRYLESSGATLSIVSEPGKGSVFTIIIDERNGFIRK